MQIVNLILFIISFLLGGGFVIAIIRNDIKKKNYTNFINGMYLQRYSGPDKITKDRAIQILFVIKEHYQEVGIDASLRNLKAKGFIS